MTGKLSENNQNEINEIFNKKEKYNTYIVFVNM